MAQSHRNELTKHSGARPVLRWARSGWVLGLVWRICRRNAGGGGLPPVFSGPAETDRFAWAPAWDVYGTKVDIENGELPQPGDIMRFAWHSGGEHVTFYDHPVDSDELYHCCGGNQGTGHVVSIEGMPMSCIVAVRRPTAVVIAAAQPAAPAVPG